jgi:hypothetical protein
MPEIVMVEIGNPKNGRENMRQKEGFERRRTGN